MSILLEALRKSEQSRQPVEVPVIDAAQQAAVDTGSVRKGPLALLLLLALLLIAWIVWRQYQPPADGYQPPVTLPAKQDGAIATPVSSLQVTDSGTDSGKVAKGGSKQQRTPVEQYQQTARDTTKSTAGRSQTAKPKPRPADVGGSKVREIAAKKPAGKARVADRHPAPISYWELPDAVRADIAEIRFSVLVYANNPADRFVLVNGQRLQQGDSYQPGLVVKEIRRDGVVFSYRLYQFLVER